VSHEIGKGMALDVCKCRKFQLDRIFETIETRTIVFKGGVHNNDIKLQHIHQGDNSMKTKEQIDQLHAFITSIYS